MSISSIQEPEHNRLQRTIESLTQNFDSIKSQGLLMNEELSHLQLNLKTSQPKKHVVEENRRLLHKLENLTKKVKLAEQQSNRIQAENLQLRNQINSMRGDKIVNKEIMTRITFDVEKARSKSKGVNRQYIDTRGDGGIFSGRVNRIQSIGGGIEEALNKRHQTYSNLLMSAEQKYRSVVKQQSGQFDPIINKTEVIIGNYVTDSVIKQMSKVRVMQRINDVREELEEAISGVDYKSELLRKMCDEAGCKNVDSLVELFVKFSMQVQNFYEQLLILDTQCEVEREELGRVLGERRQILREREEGVSKRNEKIEGLKSKLQAIKNKRQQVQTTNKAHEAEYLQVAPALHRIFAIYEKIGPELLTQFRLKKNSIIHIRPANFLKILGFIEKFTYKILLVLAICKPNKKEYLYSPNNTQGPSYPLTLREIPKLLEFNFFDDQDTDETKSQFNPEELVERMTTLLSQSTKRGGISRSITPLVK